MQWLREKQVISWIHFLNQTVITIIYILTKKIIKNSVAKIKQKNKHIDTANFMLEHPHCLYE